MGAVTNTEPPILQHFLGRRARHLVTGQLPLTISIMKSNLFSEKQSIILYVDLFSVPTMFLQEKPFLNLQNALFTAMVFH